ncbi:MAG TPA: nuclear transport factor 2 family protein [Burkholderiales bacterium]|nr:nuclear transport factor 2 family protein [Burkholderiales bacterium]
MKALLFGSPLEAEAAFYRAFEEADLESMMAVWADDEDIICIHPSGPRLCGAEAIRESWRQLFRDGPSLRFSLTGRQLVNGATLAVSSLTENIQVIGEAGPRHSVTTTNVYLLTTRGWRMLAHHASPAAKVSETPPRDMPTVLH